jgi:30S ribosomal protein S16
VVEKARKSKEEKAVKAAAEIAAAEEASE